MSIAPPRAVRVNTSAGWVDLAIQGPPGSGAAAGDKTYLHVQGVADTVWTITHSLGKYPAVTALDSTREQIEGEVDYVDLNTVTVTFAGALSGSATLN
jgi:hypothetical protein